MTTRADASDESGLMRLLQQIEHEGPDRHHLAIATIDGEFQSEFGVPRQPRPSIEPGPEPWDGFLDLSLI